MNEIWRPSQVQLHESQDKTVSDVICPGLKVLFCGINPSLYSVAVGHHFARPGNRFWPALFAAGFTPRLYSPFEDHLLLDSGYGITNVVDRATTSAAEVSAEEFKEGGRRLEEKVSDNRPANVAFLGIIAYRTAFSRPRAVVGLQEETISGTSLWVLPNPSGLNAHYQKSDLAKLFGELLKVSDLNSNQPSS